MLPRWRRRKKSPPSTPVYIGGPQFSSGTVVSYGSIRTSSSKIMVNLTPEFTGPVETLEEPIIAWRQWKVDEEAVLRGEDCLKGIFSPYIWKAGQANVAEHFEWGNDYMDRTYYCTSHSCHNLSLCNLCGFWGYKEFSFLELPNTNKLYAFGKVALWGSVAQGTKGYRATKAYPDTIWIPNRNARDMAGNMVDEFRGKGWDGKVAEHIRNHYKIECFNGEMEEVKQLVVKEKYGPDAYIIHEEGPQSDR